MWCHVGVVAVDDGGCSCVAHCVCERVCAVCVGDGCGGGRVWVLCFPLVGGGGVGE